MDFPGFDETSSDAGSPVPAEGWHHVTLSDMEFATSKSGNEMLVAQLVIDAGPDAHKELTEYMVMGMDLGEARLKAFSENARSKNHQDGFRWSQDVNSWEAFASQFVTDPRLRFQVKVEHEWSIETDRGWKNDVGEEKYNAHVANGGDGRISATIAMPPGESVKPPEVKAETAVAGSDGEAPEAENGFPEYGEEDDGFPGEPAGDGAASDGEDGDGLPF